MALHYTRGYTVFVGLGKYFITVDNSEIKKSTGAYIFSCMQLLTNTLSQQMFVWLYTQHFIFTFVEFLTDRMRFTKNSI